MARAARRARQVAHAGSAEPGLPRTVWSGLSRPGPLGSGRRAPAPGLPGAPRRPRLRPGARQSRRPPGLCRTPGPPWEFPPPATGAQVSAAARSPPQRAPYLSALPTYLSALPTYLNPLPTSARSVPHRAPYLPQPAPHLSALRTSPRSPPQRASYLPQPAPHLCALRTSARSPPQPAPTSARSLPQPARARCPGRVNSDPASPQLSVSTHSARRTHVTPSKKQWLLARPCAGRGPRVLARRREGLGCRRSRK